MQATAGNRIEKMQLRARSREEVHAALVLLEDAFRIALSDLDTGELAGSGQLIFVRKIALGLINLGKHPIALANQIRQQLKEGRLRAVCIDNEEATNADIVWFSDEIIAWSRVLEKTQKTAWYWPLVYRKLAVAPTPEVASLAIKILDYRYGTRGHFLLLQALMERQSLPDFIQQLNKSDVLPFVLKAELLSPVVRSTAAADVPDSTQAFFRRLGNHNTHQLLAAVQSLPQTDYRVIWLFENLLRFTGPAVNLRSQQGRSELSALVHFVYSTMLVDRAEKEERKLVHDDVLETVRRLAESDETNAEPGCPEADNVPALQSALPAKVTNTQAEQVKNSQTEQSAGNAKQAEVELSGTGFHAAGTFLLLNLIENIIDRHCEFSWVELPVKTALIAHLLLQLGADHDLLEKLGLQEACSPELRKAPLNGLSIRDSWWAWCTGKNLASAEQPRDFESLYRLVVKIISRYLWQNTRSGIKSLAHLYGELVISNTHLDIFLDSKNLKLENRKLGLDISPGWLPWLGKVVAIHYRGEHVKSWTLV